MEGDETLLHQEPSICNVNAHITLSNIWCLKGSRQTKPSGKINFVIKIRIFQDTDTKQSQIILFCLQYNIKFIS